MRLSAFTLPKALHLAMISLIVGGLSAQDFQAVSSVDGSQNAGGPGHSKDKGPIAVLGPVAAGQAASFANYSLLGRLPLAFSPDPPQSGATPSKPPTSPSQAKAANRPNWFRRHAVLLTGLAATGGGAALVAGGGPGTVNGCLAVPPFGQVQCTSATTWGASGRHIGGILLLSLGVTLDLVGLITHH
jgi:hypothetical protein